MQVDILQTGNFALDGGAMFGVVPKTMWERQLPADDKNRIPLALNVMLIRSEGRNIVVDTGMGDKWNDKLKQIYDYKGSQLTQELTHRGLTPQDITDVIITHMHFDHIGGLTYRDKNDKLQLTFPNATHHVNDRQWQWAQSGSPKDKASYLMDNFSPLIDSDKLNILDGPGMLFKNIEILIVNGHTPGMQLVKVENENVYLFLADLIPTHHHVPLPYVMGYDIEPMKTIEEKVEILEQAISEDWILIFEHDRDVLCGKIEKGEKHYKAIPERIK